jgi:uncharacterized protein YkwD
MILSKVKMKLEIKRDIVLLLCLTPWILCVPVTALGSPDIEILSFETAPVGVPGELLYVEYTLTNVGDFTSGPLKLTYYLSTDGVLSARNIVLSQLDIRSVKPGEVLSAYSMETVPITVPDNTYYPIIEVVPVQKGLADINLENNIFVSSLLEISSKQELPREWINQKASELLFIKTNAERERRNVKPLLYNEKLAEIAHSHVEDMAEKDYFEHVSLDGKDPTARAVEHGYPLERTRADGMVIHGIGENIVRFPTGDTIYVHSFAFIDPANPVQLADVAITSFLNSASHKKTLLSDIYEEIGIAATMASDGQYFLGQNFG